MAYSSWPRSYADPGTARDYNPDTREPGRLRHRQTSFSFTLGPIELNALVAVQRPQATLASGVRVVPADPIRQAIDRNGTRSPSPPRPAIRWCPRPWLHHGQRDEQGRGGWWHGGGFGRAAGWNLPMFRGKTGTPSRTARPLCRIHHHYAAANYIYDTRPRRRLCSAPAAHCGEGDCNA